MYGLVWGKAQQLSFADDHEYYRALGSLCRRDAYTITFETNSDTDSWSDAFRIKCLEDDQHTPDAFINAMRTARRINCNDYVQNLYEYHDFDFDVRSKLLIGNYDKVKKTIPASYYYDFDEGYNLRFTRYKKTSNKKSTVTQRTHKVERRTERIQVKPVAQSNGDSMNHKPVEPPTPMIKVNVGDKVKHKAYGIGKVYSVNGRYITIQFDEVGNKKFINPDAFNKGFIQII